MHSRTIDQARPIAERPLTLAAVDRAFIGRLMREFYGQVRNNDRLGPIFAREIPGDWEPHLEKMTEGKHPPLATSEPAHAYRLIRSSDCTFQPYSGPRWLCEK